MRTQVELLRGTEEEVRENLDDRHAQGFDGHAAQDLSTDEWIAIGTPEDSHQQFCDEGCAEAYNS